MPKHRQGGKFTGSHTTVTDFAGTIADIVSPVDSVAKICLGVIKFAPGRRGGNQTVKIKTDGHSVVLTVVQNRSAQEIRLITHGKGQNMKSDVARAIAKAGFVVTD